MTYITPQKALAHVGRLAGWREGHKQPPVTIEWDLSNRCVLGCQDCHFAHTHVRGPWASRARTLPMAFEGTGDLADMDVVRRGLGEMALVGVRGVVWSGGGEPTTHPSWQAAIDAADRVGLRQGMYTLGGLLTQAAAERLADTLDWIVVSLDAVDGTAYASEKGVPAERFDDAVSAIRFMSGRKAVVGVSFLLHARNWHEAARMRRHALDDYGANYVTFRPAIRTSPAAPNVVDDPERRWIDDAWPTLKWMHGQPNVECDADRFAKYRDWSGRGYDTCHGIKLSATVTPDGRVWICPQHRGVTAVGDLRKESFAELWDRHPGTWTDFSKCRAMCRLHLVNEQIAPVFVRREHEAFV